MRALSVILTPFAKLILLFYSITGSYGVSLLLFALVIRLILFPVFLKGRKSMLSMSGLAEKQQELAKKYARNREKYSQELAKLYEEEGVKPSGGCLWSFLPMPFLMVLYLVVRRPLTYLYVGATVPVTLLLLRQALDFSYKEELVMDTLTDYVEQMRSWTEEIPAAKKADPVLQEEIVDKITSSIKQTAASGSHFSKMLTPEEEKIMREIIREFMA